MGREINIERMKAQARALHETAIDFCLRRGWEREANVVSLAAKKLDTQIAEFSLSGTNAELKECQ